MSNVVNDFTFQGYNSSLPYKKNDVVYGINATDTRFYYATQDVQGVIPTAPVYYSGVSWERTNDVATIYFTKTGVQPDITLGTLIAIQSTVQASLNWTGVALEGGPNYVRYLNPGWDNVNQAVANFATVSTVLSPAWTTGFFWVPSNSTSVDFQTKRDFAQFGDGYTAQGRLGINSIGSTINMSFENRDYKESRAIINFVQVAGGVQPVVINLPVNRLFNNPQTTYLLTDPKIVMASYNLNNITVMATRTYNQI